MGMHVRVDVLLYNVVVVVVVVVVLWHEQVPGTGTFQYQVPLCP